MRSTIDNRMLTHLLVVAASASILVGWSHERDETQPQLADHGPIAQADDASLEVLAFIPPTATMGLLIPDLQRLAAGIDGFSQRFELGLPEGLLMTAQELLGIQSGLRTDGALALYMQGLEFLEGEMPSVVLLVPVSDYSAFLANFGLNPAEATQQFSLMEMPLFVRQVGSFAAITLDQASAESVQEWPGAPIGVTLGELGQICVEGSNLSLFFNIEVMSEPLRSWVASSLTMFEQLVSELELDGPEASTMATSLAMMRLYALAFDAILRDGKSATLGFDLYEETLGWTSTLELRESSNLANMFGTTNDASPLWALTPERPFLWATVVDIEGLDLSALLDTIDSSLAEAGESPITPWVSVWSLGMQTVRGVKRVAQIYFVPETISGSIFDSLASVTVLETDDGQAFLARFREYVESMNGLQIEMPAMPNEAGELVPMSIGYTSSFQAEVAVIEEVPVHGFSMNIQWPEGLWGEDQSANSFMRLFAMSAMNARLAVVEDVVIVVMGGDELVAESIRLARSPRVSDRFAALRARQAWWPTSSMQIFVDIRTLFDTIALLIPQESAVRVQSPQPLPPLAIYGTTTETGMGYRGILPFEAITMAIAYLEHFASSNETDASQGSGIE